MCDKKLEGAMNRPLNTIYKSMTMKTEIRRSAMSYAVGEPSPSAYSSVTPESSIFVPSPTASDQSLDIEAHLSGTQEAVLGEDPKTAVDRLAESTAALTAKDCDAAYAIESYNALAEAYDRLGDLEGKTSAMENIVRFAKGEDEDEFVATLMHLIGAYSSMGKHKTARKRAEAAVRYLDGTSRYLDLAVAHHNLAVEMEYLQEWKTALANYNEAAFIITKYSDPGHPIAAKLMKARLQAMSDLTRKTTYSGHVRSDRLKRGTKSAYLGKMKVEHTVVRTRKRRPRTPNEVARETISRNPTVGEIRVPPPTREAKFGKKTNRLYRFESIDNMIGASYQPNRILAEQARQPSPRTHAVPEHVRNTIWKAGRTRRLDSKGRPETAPESRPESILKIGSDSGENGVNAWPHSPRDGGATPPNGTPRAPHTDKGRAAPEAVWVRPHTMSAPPPPAGSPPDVGRPRRGRRARVCEHGTRRRLAETHESLTAQYGLGP